MASYSQILSRPSSYQLGSLAILLVAGAVSALAPAWVVLGVLALFVLVMALISPVIGIFTLLVIRGFWDTTQFTAIKGVSWWDWLYSESGPILLPIIAIGVAVLIARFAAVSALQKRVRRIDVYGTLIVVTIVFGTINAILRQNDIVKILKDVCFIGGLLLALVVSSLNVRQAKFIFVSTLAIACISDIATFFEATRRMMYFGQDIQTFLLHTYRIIKTDHFAPLVVLLGFFLAYPRKYTSGKVQILLIIFIYYILRFVFNFTRLNWIILFATIFVYIIIHSGQNIIRHINKFIRLSIAMGIAVYVLTGATTGIWNFMQQPLVERFTNINLQKDVSIRFRITESKMLWKDFVRSPIIGVGLGTAISPMDPDEPQRNEITAFFNGYFGLLQKVGLVGTVCILVYLAVFFRELLYARKRVVDPFSRAMINGAFIYYIGLALIIPISDTLFSNFYSIIFAMVVGSALAVAREKPTLEQATS